MTTRGGALMLVLTSPILRSALVARLGLAGEIFQTADALGTVRMASARRGAAMLVVDRAALPDDCSDIDAQLAADGWTGPICLLADAEMPGLPGRITWIDTRQPMSEVVEQLRAWRNPAG